MEGAPLGKHNLFDMRKNEKQRRRGARFQGRWADTQSNLQNSGDIKIMLNRLAD